MKDLVLWSFTFTSHSIKQVFVKNYKGSGILSCLQTNSLACHSFIDVGKYMRHLGGRQRILLPIEKETTWASWSYGFPMLPSSMWAIQRGQNGSIHLDTDTVSLCHSSKTPKVGNPQSYKKKCKQTCLTFVPEGNKSTLFPRSRHYA